MANKTISDLNELTTVSNSDVLLVETTTETSKVTKENLLKEINTQLNNKSDTTHTHSNYQTKEDSALTTINKTIVGAINELFDMILGSNGSLRLSHSFSNEASGYAYGSIALSSYGATNDGTYNICWGNASGKLSDYKDIASFTLSGNMVKTYDFIPTNIIPKEATKILAIKDNEIKAEYIIPSNKLNADTKLYSIGLLSDIHIDVTNDQSNSVSDFQNALSRFKAENVTAICCTGDTVVDGTQAEVEKFIEVKNSTTIPMYIARGNHDCRSYSLANWNLVEPNGVYFEKEVGGDIYLFMGLNAENYTDNIFTTAQLDWLEQRLEYYKNRRVFLFEHVFIEPVGNVNSLYPWSSMGNTEGQPAKRFRNLMKKYRNVILFTGHSHLEFILQRLGDNANCSERTSILCHRVHIPSCAQPRANDESTEDIKENTYAKYGSSEGYVMDVYQNYIILKGINFVDNKYLPLAQYRINTTPIIYDIDESNLLFYLDGSNPENTTSVIKDLSGNGNDFIAHNIALNTVNGSITFNGSSSYLINETLQPVSTANDIFSFEVVLESNIGRRTDSQMIFSLGKSSPNRINSRYKSNSADKDIQLYSDYGTTSALSINDSAIKTDFTEKHHIVMVRKNGHIDTYIDGVLNKTITKDSDTTTIEPRTTIGAKYNYSNNFFGGNIYMCKLYTRELTAEEILHKYNDIIDNDDTLLFYLDGSNSENTTSVIKDLSGNNNDFVANNIALDTANGAITFNGNGYLVNETLQPISTINDSFSFEFVAECSLTNNTANSIISIGNSKPGRITYRINPVEGNDDVYTECGSSTAIDSTSTNGGTTETDFNKKSHIVIVKEANTLISYVNGALNKSVTLTEETSIINVNPRVAIGVKYDLAKNFLNGKIYMCKLYTRVLTPEEITKKYNETNK